MWRCAGVIVLSVALALASKPPNAAPAGRSSAPGDDLHVGFDQLYNRDYAGARQSFALWSAHHPGNAMGPASEAAATLFEEMDRLHLLDSRVYTNDRAFLAGPAHPPSRKALTTLDGDWSRCEAMTAGALKRRPHDVQALFADALCHGIRTEELALLEKRDLAALNSMKATSALARRVLALDPRLDDAWLGPGLENYILSLKPAPIRWLLRLDGASSNRARGLRQLRLVATQGDYFRPYAQILLALIDLRTHKPAAAAQRFESLARQFPQNALFQKELSRLATQSNVAPKIKTAGSPTGPPAALNRH